MRIEERDIKVFDILYKYRLLSSGIIQSLVFNGSTTFRRRLKKLKDNGFLHTIPLTDSSTGKRRDNVYFLKEPAYEYIKQPFRRQSIPKSKYLAHAIDTISCRIKIERAIALHSHIIIRSYITERETKTLSDGRLVKVIYDKYFSPRVQRDITITPDSTFIIELANDTQKNVIYFVEIDEASEPHSVIAAKIKSYWDYYNHREHNVKRFMLRHNVNVDMMRVLFVTTSMQRISRLLKSLSLEEGLRLFFFTTFDSLLSSNDLTEDIFQNNIKGRVALIRAAKPNV